MKTPEKIEKLADNYANEKSSSEVFRDTHKKDFINGYTQCQQDNTDKKYTEEDLHTILKLRREWYSHTDKNVVRDFIKSLNK